MFDSTFHKQHFDTFGFIVIRQFFTPEEIKTISNAFDQVMLEDRGGKLFNGEECQLVYDWWRKHPDAAFLEHDAHIRAKACELLGPDCYLREDGNDGRYFVGDTSWHPDMGWDAAIPEGENDPYRRAGNLTLHYEPSIKVACYLDTVGKDSGALRVIPGSHKNPLHEELWSLHLDIPMRAKTLEHVAPKLKEMWERDAGSPDGFEALMTDPSVNLFGTTPEDIPCHALESNPGDLVFFSHQLWHASFGGHSGRRMFAYNFYTKRL